MSSNNISSEAEQIANELADSGIETTDELLTDIQELLNYHVQPDEIKRSVRNNHGDGYDSGGSGEPEPDATSMAEIGNEEGQWCEFDVEVLEVVEGSENFHESIERVIHVGQGGHSMELTIFTDAEGIVPEEGDTVHLDSVVTDSYNGKLTLAANKASEITESDATLDCTARVEDAFTGRVISINEQALKEVDDEDDDREMKYQLSFIVDDGIENRTVYATPEVTAEVLGMSKDEAVEQAREAMTKDCFGDEIREAIGGQTVEVVGGELDENGFWAEELNFDAYELEESIEETLVEAREAQAAL